MPWLVLIYTVPRSPSRKRAFVWRELKKIGAVYLRDGVCALPDRDDTRRKVQDIAASVRELEGRAIVIADVELDVATIESIVTESAAARRAEYDEIISELSGFLNHIEHEQAHREMTYPELEELDSDLDKLRRWIEQVQSRDHFGHEVPDRVVCLLARCSDDLMVLRDSVIDETGSEL